MKLDKFVVRKSFSTQSKEINSYIFLSGLIIKLILDRYSVFLSIFRSHFLLLSFPLYILFPFLFSLHVQSRLVDLNTCHISPFP